MNKILETPKALLWPGRGGKIDYISRPPEKELWQKKPRRLAILGSTGSVGRQALEVIIKDRNFFQIDGLAGGKNADLLAQQAEIFRPAILGVQNEETADRLRKKISYNPEIVIGQKGYELIAKSETTDWVLSAQSGSAGLAGVIAATEKGKIIALANKESLVMAGGLLRSLCEKTGAVILPVDSEHQALFQCAAGRNQTPAKFILTASGGPFRGKKPEELKNISPKAAIRHPRWDMGQKISVDSATLMNKGLEIIEARALFGIGSDLIDVIIHPQSIIHSLITFLDNSLLAQLALPDMKLPIGIALYWPFCEKNLVAPLDLTAVGELTFEKPDLQTFPCLALALKTLNHVPDKTWQGLNINPAFIALNCANEEAVETFLRGECGFYDIYLTIEHVLNIAINHWQMQGDNADFKKIPEIIHQLCVKARKSAQEFLVANKIQT